MKLFKPYSSIKDFLYRFTILKIGKLHIRLHKIVDKDNTTLFHNHPFKYVSIILKGGYTETIINNKQEQVLSHSIGSIIIRDNNTFHRIDSIKGKTLTLFFAYGNYGWEAFNTHHADDDGIYQRTINNQYVWSKKVGGIWYIGNRNKDIASKETRHSIHQVI